MLKLAGICRERLVKVKIGIVWHRSLEGKMHETDCIMQKGLFFDYWETYFYADFAGKTHGVSPAKRIPAGAAFDQRRKMKSKNEKAA